MRTLVILFLIALLIIFGATLKSNRDLEKRIQALEELATKATLDKYWGEYPGQRGLGATEWQKNREKTKHDLLNNCAAKK